MNDVIEIVDKHFAGIWYIESIFKSAANNAQMFPALIPESGTTGSQSHESCRVTSPNHYTTGPLCIVKRDFTQLFVNQCHVTV